MAVKEMIVRFLSEFGKSGQPPTQEIKELADQTRAAATAADAHTAAAGREASAVKSLADALSVQAREQANLSSQRANGGSDPSLGVASEWQANEASNMRAKAAAVRAESDKVIDAARARAADLAAHRSMTDPGQEMGAGSSKAANEMERASRAAWGMRMAANGSTEGIRGLTNAAMNAGGAMGSLVAKVTSIGAAFMAGWQVGDMIRKKLIDPVIEAGVYTDALSIKAVESARKYKELNSVSMTKLVGELSGIKATTDEVIGAIERVYARQKELEAAQSSASVASIIATQQAGPERDKAVAEEQYRQKVEQETRNKQAADQTLAANRAALETAQGKIDQLVSELSNVRSKRGAVLQSGRMLTGEEAGQFRDAETNTQKALDDASKELDKLKDQISESNQAAQNKKDIADQRIKEAEFNRRSALQEADATIAQRAMDTTVPMPEGGNDNIRMGMAARGARAAGRLVRPLSSEDGVITPRGGAQTQSDTLASINEAARSVAQGGASEADAFVALVAKMKERGSVTTGGLKALMDAFDQVDGELGNLKGEIDRLKSREKSTRGLD